MWIVEMQGWGGGQEPAAVDDPLRWKGREVDRSWKKEYYFLVLCV